MEELKEEEEELEQEDEEKEDDEACRHTCMGMRSCLGRRRATHITES